MPPARLFLHWSASADVYENLAREEYLFDGASADALTFLLYENEESVVVGKHQNIWREVDVGLARSREINLARRISGGGTVFHGRGNLNFSFLMPKAHFDRRRNLEIVVRALGRLGIEAEVSERFDLLVAGRKISGNAFCYRRDLALHHGTLLVDARIDSLRSLLAGIEGAARRRGGQARIESFAVASRPAEVVNLCELRPGTAVEEVGNALVAEVSHFFGAVPVESLGEEPFRAARVQELRSRNADRAWILAASPRFVAELAAPATRGGASVRLTVEQGRIAAAEGSIPGSEARLLVDHAFDAEELSAVLDPAGGEETARTGGAADFAAWLREVGF